MWPFGIMNIYIFWFEVLLSLVTLSSSRWELQQNWGVTECFPVVRYEGAYLSLESVGSSLEAKIWSKDVWKDGWRHRENVLINWNFLQNVYDQTKNGLYDDPLAFQGAKFGFWTCWKSLDLRSLWFLDKDLVLSCSWSDQRLIKSKESTRMTRTDGYFSHCILVHPICTKNSALNLGRKPKIGCSCDSMMTVVWTLLAGGSLRVFFHVTLP